MKQIPKVSNKGAQEVKPIVSQTPAKGGKVTTGKDLRTK